MPKPGPLPQTSQTAATSITPQVDRIAPSVGARPGRDTGRASVQGNHPPGGDQTGATKTTESYPPRRLRRLPSPRLATLGPRCTRRYRKECARVLRVLDAGAIRRWADASVDLLEAHRAELDRINVFPVADGDTGTNLVLTLRAAAEELARRPVPVGPADTAAEVAAALARGALRGARGNSGVIVSQLPRGLAEVLADAEDWAVDGVDGPALAAALCRADELARAAVSRPVEGTMLSVLRAAATDSSAAANRGGALADVVAAAVEGAAVALADTPRQLPVLARAGVVDAGGRGLALLLDALAGVVNGRPGGTAVVAGAVSAVVVPGAPEPLD